MNTSTSCPDLPLQSGCPSHWNRDFILFYSVHIFALVTSTISFLACVTVILNVIRNKLCESRKNVVDRFPLYIAVNDALFCTMHGIDQLILLVTEVYPAKWVVFVLGSSTMFLYWWVNFGEYKDSNLRNMTLLKIMLPLLKVNTVYLNSKISKLF